MFITIKKKVILWVICGILCFIGVIFFWSLTKETTSPATRFSIVIDAGHGGLDVK